MAFKFKLVEEIDPKFENARNDYRRYADIDADVEITNENLNEWALNRAAIEHNIPKRDLRHIVLGEDLTIDQAARELEASKEEANTKSQIEQALDDTLETAEEMAYTQSSNGYPALLLEGEAGIGKTAIVNSWCTKNNVVFKELELSGLKPEVLAGIIDRHPVTDVFVIRKISTELLAKFTKPRTVLFIDEYNRADKKLRNLFLDLILNHKMYVPTTGDYEADKELYAPYGDLQESGKLFIKNLLFVVCAQNPYNIRYAGTNPLDAAETDRLAKYEVEADPLSVENYLVKEYNRQLEAVKSSGNEKLILKAEGRVDLIKTILGDPSFRFSGRKEREELFDEDPNAKVTSPRSFEALIKACNGTKADLLSKWDKYCSYKQRGLIETILSDYIDVEDRANDALKGGTQSPVFGKNLSNVDKLFAKNPELNQP